MGYWKPVTRFIVSFHFKIDVTFLSREVKIPLSCSWRCCYSFFFWVGMGAGGHYTRLKSLLSIEIGFIFGILFLVIQLSLLLTIIEGSDRCNSKDFWCTIVVPVVIWKFNFDPLVIPLLTKSPFSLAKCFFLKSSQGAIEVQTLFSKFPFLYWWNYFFQDTYHLNWIREKKKKKDNKREDLRLLYFILDQLSPIVHNVQNRPTPIPYI